MRTFFKLMTGAAAAATVVAMAVAPAAMADPPKGVQPRPTDVVGVGSDTTQFLLDQLSHDYNKTVHASATHLYSWDAIGSASITTKGSKGNVHCTIPRPVGSSAGITALNTMNGTISGHPCIDFARSSRDRTPADLPYSPGGNSFVALAADAVTYATQPHSAIPGNLTTHQLTAIYECTLTHFGATTIKPYLPQTGSGTRKFFLTAIGVTTPGPCVSWGQTPTNPVGTIAENEGVNVLLNGSAANKRGMILPFSVADYIAQGFHSPACKVAGCPPLNKGLGSPACKTPKPGQNIFGCNVNGPLRLNKINGTSPTKPFPPSGKSPVLNSGFTPLFKRTVYDVVKFPTAGGVNGIPLNLAHFFGPTGFACISKVAKKDIASYGFGVLRAGTMTGHATNRCGDAH